MPDNQFPLGLFPDGNETDDGYGLDSKARALAEEKMYQRKSAVMAQALAEEELYRELSPVAIRAGHRIANSIINGGN